jgi:hypothetical protein
MKMYIHVFYFCYFSLKIFNGIIIIINVIIIISVKDKFPLINNTGVWLSGYLIVPYYGKLIPDQIFTPCTPEAGAPAAAINSAADPAGNDGANGGGSTST